MKKERRSHIAYNKFRKIIEEVLSRKLTAAEQSDLIFEIAKEAEKNPVLRQRDKRQFFNASDHAYVFPKK